MRRPVVYSELHAKIFHITIAFVVVTSLAILFFVPVK